MSSLALRVSVGRSSRNCAASDGRAQTTAGARGSAGTAKRVSGSANTRSNAATGGAWLSVGCLVVWLPASCAGWSAGAGETTATVVNDSDKTAESPAAGADRKLIATVGSSVVVLAALPTT